MRETEEFTRSFREVQLKFSRFYVVILSQLGLTLPQYALLNQLLVTDMMPMTQTSKKLHITKPAVTGLVDRLEKNKFLKRISHPKDRRIYLLQIQPKGIKLVRQIQEHVLQVLLDTLAQFTSNERKVINQFYALLSQTLGKILTQPRKLKK